MITNPVEKLYPQDLRAWQDIYGEDMPSTADGLCGRAIADFRDFGKKYQGYFEQVIRTEDFKPEKTTPDRLRARYFQTFNDYWMPLGQVAAQRQIRPYRDFLDRGTEEAEIYLDDLNAKLGGERLPGVLVYFNKVTSIRYFPYSDIAFVGTPYTQIASADWMAIPHELGHYLYWNLRGTLEQTRKKHQQIKKSAAARLKEVPELQNLLTVEAAEAMLLSWLEEIFCDVVGTRLGGSDFIVSLQSLIKSCAGCSDDLLTNDGYHPPLCVRWAVREHVYGLNGGSSQIDWERFFARTFNVENLKQLQLKVFPPDLKDVMGTMPAEDLLEALAAEECADLPFIRFKVSEILPALAVLTTLCNEQLNDFLESGGFKPTQPASGFEDLLALAEQEAEEQDVPTYSLLLRPRVLEGGYQHTHGCMTLHGWHEPWTHNH